MQPGALRALEFDRIVEAVRGLALTPMGDERLARLAPSTDAQKVGQLLAATTETTKFLAANALFPLRATGELPQILQLLAVEGARARGAPPARARGLSRFGRRDAQRDPPRGRIVSRCSRRPAAAPRRSRVKRRRRARRSSRPATSLTPRAPSCG